MCVTRGCFCSSRARIPVVKGMDRWSQVVKCRGATIVDGHGTRSTLLNRQSRELLNFCLPPPLDCDKETQITLDHLAQLSSIFASSRVLQSGRGVDLVFDMHGDKNEEPSQTRESVCCCLSLVTPDSPAPSSQSRHPSLPPRPSAAGAVQPGPRPAVRQSLQHSAMTHPLPPRPTPSPVPFDTTLLRYADDGDSSSRVAKEPSLTPMAVSQEVSKSEDSASQEPALATQSPSSDLVPNPLKRKLEDDTAAAEITETIVQPKPTVIPILPTPLPSKRFKKGAHSKALLIPVEQLPVFALPPLPVITDPILLTQVFNHQSLFGRHRGRFEDAVDKPQMDYEKLEHVGDSILGMVVTTWLQETKPGLTCGTASVSYRVPTNFPWRRS